ncbi:2,3-bisphosphoglycerate-independent phosphoglycerate mutase [Candidatus Berkelbacteria bacterium]|nr:2,3-bisphosphoglycerate-independent phosphoglycerate mutase [Candidatus Berkelbacteria bacterium]
MPKPVVTDMHRRPKPVVLVIIDGWGVSPSWGGNAISANNPPTFQYLWKYYPHAILQAFRVVADTTGVVGSSEIGHASIGSGRLVKQDLTELNLAIGSGQFFQNPGLRDAFQRVRADGGVVHLTGLLSDGGIHGDDRHALALAEFAKREGIEKVWLHPILDGIDVDTTSGLRYLERLETGLGQLGVGTVATVMGRYYGMDKGGYWDRTERAYRAMVMGEGNRARSSTEALTQAYQAGLDDEHLVPTVVSDGGSGGQTATAKRYVAGRVQPGDLLIHWNFRADRARQLVRAFADPRALRRLFLRHFPLCGARVVTMTDYHLDLPLVQVAFPAAAIENTLAHLLANHGYSQLHVAESEKYAHVTYFFNGGREEPYPNEDRLILPSPRAESYQTVPAMNAGGITRALEQAIRKRSHDFIVANFANVDMVAHTGNLIATGEAVLVVDEALRRIANAVIDVGGVLFITADHGNAESVVTLERGDRETLHTLNPVPFLYVAADAKKDERLAGHPIRANLLGQIVQSKHTLADVAPTVLEIFGVPKPSDMTGSSLFPNLE